jgi:steroid delta-isomerase-like uncharacterized protein
MKKSFRWSTRLATAIFLFALCLTLSCQQMGKDAITEEETRTLNERILQIWNQGNLALVDEVYTDESVRYDCGWPHPIRGPEGLKNHFKFYRTAFPDIYMAIQETIVKGNKVVWHWTLAGTNTGLMGEAPPTGKEVRLSGVSIGRIENGKIAEVGDFYNQASMLQQLGFRISPPQGESEGEP